MVAPIGLGEGSSRDPAPSASGVRDGALRDLLARVEAAEGPNFELERALFETLAIPTEWFGSRVTGFFRNRAAYGFNTEDGFRHLDCLKAPNYTASLDAALALVERCLPGWGAVIGYPARLGEHGGRPWADVWAARDDERWPWASKQLRPTPYFSNAATRPLALLAALLEAFIASGQDGTSDAELGPGRTK